MAQKWTPWWSEGEPYLFVSYVSTDRDKVQATRDVLDRRGFRCWYDRFIVPGSDWEESIMKQIQGSSAFLGFISHDFAERPIARKEIMEAFEMRKKDPKYKMILVLLDSGALTAFLDDDSDEMEKLRAKIDKMQYIRYWQEGGIAGGLTEDFIVRLAGAPWPKEIIDEERRKENDFAPWVPGEFQEEELQSLLDEANRMPWRTHHRLLDKFQPREEFVEGQTLRFYPVGDAQLEPTAVYPIIMDNQWVPREIYDSAQLLSDFHQHGLKSPEVADIIVRRQRKEITRALLHNWQIIVNRASIFNSKVFSDWYCPDNPEYPAFRDMMGDDSIVVYLFGEPRPTDKPSFDVNPDIFQNWRDFCINAPKEQEISCLRLDWDSEKSNAYEINKLLGYRFQNFCLITAQDQYRMDALMAALEIRRERRDAFIKRWREVQQAAIQWNEKTGKTYTRNQFYNDFIVRKGSKVDECLVDAGKPFADELKQIIDFVYAMNLPDALNLTPAIPPDSPMTAFRYSERSEIQGQREISAEELAFASEEFTRSVRAAMKDDNSAEDDDSAESAKDDDSAKYFCKVNLPVPAQTDFTLGQLYEIRASKKWRRYLRRLTDGKTRSRLSELDFHNIPGVWGSYWRFLRWMSQEEAFRDCGWSEKPPAVSVLYHFEETTLATVYERTADGTPRLIMAFPDGWEERESLKRKTALWIDYVCGNIIDGAGSPWMENLLLTEIRLFEGMTRVNGSPVFDRLRRSLSESGFERVPIPDFV